MTWGFVREVRWQVAIDMARCRNMSKGRKRKIEREEREENKRVCMGGGGEIGSANGTGFQGYLSG